MLPALVLCALAATLLGRIYYSNRRARQLYRCDWNDLFQRIELIPGIAVARIADEYLNPKPHQLGSEPVDIWLGLGGLEGIRCMRRNARILIALASYAQRWNFTESVIVAERMRRDALHLQMATFQVLVRSALGLGRLRVAFHLHESVAAYHLMTKRLLALYQTSHAGLYPRLVEVLGDGRSGTTIASALV